MELPGLGSVIELIRQRVDANDRGAISSDERLADVLRGVADELAAPTTPASPKLLDSIEVFFIGVDDDRCIRFLNQRARELLGQDALKKSITSVLSAASEREKERLDRFVAPSSDTHSCLQHSLRTADGATRIVDWHKQVLPLGVADFTIVLTGMDVTERAGRERALRDSERKLLEMCNSLPALVAYVDADERYQFNNDAYQWTLGITPESLKGRHIGDVWDDKTIAAGAPQRAKVMAGESSTFEAQIYDREGAPRDVVVQYTPHSTEEGQVVGFVEMTSDVTEHKRLERALRHSQKMEALGRLASGCAHDFNNLMMGIGGCSNVALEMLDAASPVRRFLEEIRSAATNGASVTRQLLDFSHESAGETTDVGLDETIRGHEIMLQYLLGSDIELRQDLAAGNSQVRVVQGQLEQLLMNLIVNARDAMPEGGHVDVRTSQVDVDAEQAALHAGAAPGRFAKLVIKDTGVGMDAQILEQIFDPFFTTKEVGEGSGLGLSAVYGTVKQAGGMINVESKPGRGTTFTVWLPIQESPDESRALPPRVEPAKQPSPALAAPPPRQTVLLVEDHRLVRLTVHHQLEEAGFRVIDAESGDEAIEHARRASALTVLVTDMVLPGISGAVVAEQVREMHPEVKVICMSAHSPTMLAEGGYLKERVEILQKPFTREQLLGRVREVLQGDGAVH